MVELGELQRNWDRFGVDDPLWAVLTGPGKDLGRWDPDQFLASGEDELRVLMPLVEQALPDGLGRARALDFGCGVGRLSQALAGYFDRVDGVDIAPSMLEVARQMNRRGDRVRFHLNQTADLAAFPTAGTDFVYTAHVLQHMEPRYALGYLDEFMRVLRPGGAACLELATEPVVGCTEPLPDDAFAATVRILDAPARMPAGSRQLVRVAVSNDSRVTWPAAGRDGWYLVDAGNHWLGRDGRTLVVDDARVSLAADLLPGQTAELDLNVTAPGRPGRYRLRVDLCQEGVTWFVDRGARPAEVPVQVHRTGPRRPWRPPATAPPTTAADGPRMEMYGIPEPQLRERAAGAGGTVVSVLDWAQLFGHRYYDWHRRCFVVRRD